MKTIIASAAIAAIACAAPMYEGEDWIFQSDDAWYFSLKYKYSVDAEYGTYYSGEQAGGYNQVTYGTFAKMWAWGSLVFEFMDFYWIEERGVLDFFDVKPISYSQYYTDNY